MPQNIFFLFFLITEKDKNLVKKGSDLTINRADSDRLDTHVHLLETLTPLLTP